MASSTAQRPPQMALGGVRHILSELEEHFRDPGKRPGSGTVGHPKLTHLIEVSQVFLFSPCFEICSYLSVFFLFFFF